jgi:inner membrane protein
MSSVLGHGLVGISVASAIGGNQPAGKRRKLLLIAALTAIVPDLDILVYIAFGPLGITPHRGITHTLLFAAMMGAALAAISRSYFSLNFRTAFLLFSGVMVSHLLLDYLMGCGPAVPFFWPFADQGYLFPYKVVPTAYYGLSSKGLIFALLYPPNIFCMLLETIIFLPPFLILSGKATLPKWCLSAVSLIGLLCSIVIYNRLL